MKRWCALLIFLLYPAWAQGHLGSPDIFFDGLVGPYPAHITIRMPGVVPGRATILIQARSDETVTADFAPIASETAVSNAPAAEQAAPVAGETNLFSGELWLMTSGAYSIQVHIVGKTGDGTVQIPVNSVATSQLPLPSWLGGALLVLGIILFCSGVAIVAAAAGEGVLPPNAETGPVTRRRYTTAAIVTALVFILLLLGARKWWNSDDADFRARLRDGGWPDLAASVSTRGSQQILRLEIGETELPRKQKLTLAPDHGKLLHLFLVRQPDHSAFAHLHPLRTGGKTFEVALPPLPEGDYEVLCDLTLADSGASSTATNLVHIGAFSGKSDSGKTMRIDPDDSSAIDASIAARDKPDIDTISKLPNGTQVIWKAHPALRARNDAGLRFEVRDASGQPVPLESYMGMMSHAAVLRSDGRVFTHLHPSGNFSMAAQNFFDQKIGGAKPISVNTITNEVICGPGHNGIILPYEFPTGGDYRIWVQIKTGGQVMTAIFDTTVL